MVYVNLFCFLLLIHFSLHVLFYVCIKFTFHYVFHCRSVQDFLFRDNLLSHTIIFLNSSSSKCHRLLHSSYTIFVVTSLFVNLEGIFIKTTLQLFYSSYMKVSQIKITLKTLPHIVFILSNITKICV